MAATTYLVNDPIKHDGVDYAIGDTIIIEDELAARSLLDANVITEIEESSVDDASKKNRKK